MTKKWVLKFCLQNDGSVYFDFKNVIAVSFVNVMAAKVCMITSQVEQLFCIRVEQIVQQ